jgi:Helicase conserved C-terminal domain
VIDPEEELAGLTDFQRRTARYAFRRMYRDHNPALRFLVADEVGLGKTLVARAVVAQTVAHLRELGDRRIDVVYVCSNTAIARQNLRKLAPSGLDDGVNAGRLSLLPGQADALRDDVNLVALTPGTSLQHGTSLGTLRERVLALEFLASALGAETVENLGVYRAFAGNIGNADASLSVLRERFAAALGTLAPVWGAKRIFQTEFGVVGRQYREKNGQSIREDLAWLADEFRKTSRRDPSASQVRNDLVGHVRRAMAATGAGLLRPDLVIFDEFQRFADLLHTDDTELQPLVTRLLEGDVARNVEATRTLLLSATPYRMHTTDIERAAGEEDHYRDLLRTVSFLLGDAGADETARLLRRLRDALTHVPQDGLGSVRQATSALSELLRSVMVRTERLASTPDRDGMLRTVTHDVPGPTAEDIRAYLAATRTTDRLPTRNGAPRYDLVELWKSTPYVLSFLNDNYQVKAALRAALDAGTPPGLTERFGGTPAVLPWEDVDAYRPVDPGNARMRHLIADTAATDLCRLLWLPASAPYYRAGGPFESAAARAFTKRLVFSAWHAVPNAVSAMVSYEAERATVGVARREVSYVDATEKATRPLRADAESTYLLLYPSLVLADIVDPLAIAAGTGVQLPTWEALYEAAHRSLAPSIRRLTENHAEGGRDDRWYGLAMLLLDAERSPAGPADSVVDLGKTGADDESTAYEIHMRRWQDIAASGQIPDGMGAAPDDLVDVITEITLASPAVCALRALRRMQPDADPADHFAAAARIASGFRALFNGPEATAIVASSTDDAAFWRECLQYCAKGNLQAVLDEYLHVLTEWRRFGSSTIGELAALVHDALALRAVPYNVDVVDADTLTTRRMRGRYAARFGNATDEAQGEMRADRVSDAFNSPFWPFILATTSIGQEGLDFHLYCHAVVHWNLPHNPVDLEQREGRVHRYKGHAVRKNVAQRCGLPDKPDGDPWKAMFEAATKWRPAGETEIVPYWVFDGPATIERHLLVPPYTRDASVLPHLLDSTAMYRIAFGQPRQEELLRGLGATLTEAQRAELQQIRVDLTPRSDEPVVPAGAAAVEDERCL